MTVMEQWAIVFESYKEANFVGLVKKTLTKSKSSLLAILTFIFFFFSIIWSFNIEFRFIKTYPHIDYLVLFFTIILAFLLFKRAIKNSFEEYYKDNIQSKLLKCYKKDLEYERYLLFKEKLAHKKEEIDFRQILLFIDNELEMAKVSMFKQYPFLTVLIGIVTAIVGGLASREQGGEGEIELAPQATTKESLSIERYITPAIKKMSEYPNMTKDFAIQQNISFGFAIKYRLIDQNIDKTMFKQNSYNLYNVISSL
jgi:hypothetical protein